MQSYEKYIPDYFYGECNYFLFFVDHFNKHVKTII